MKVTKVRALIAGVVVIEIVAASAAVAGARNLPSRCTTELIARCGGASMSSIGCLRSEAAKVKAFCRQALIEGAVPGTRRND